MLDIFDYLSNARKNGICHDGIRLILSSYKKGIEGGNEAHQSCLPLEIVKSNLIRGILVSGKPGRGNATNRDGKLIGLMARIYYDAFNTKVIERGILSSENLP